MARRPLRVGTRGSPLALLQARAVVAMVGAVEPAAELELVVVTTAGDRSQDAAPSSFAERGIFVHEIQGALLRGDVDLAVHSLKDVPMTTPDGLTIAAVPLREDPRDVVHFRDGTMTWAALPPGARLGTSSQRRTALLRHLRPDLRFMPIRGNVGTRIAKVDRGDYDGAILAAAGLHRLGLHQCITEYLDHDTCLPEAGQGALAVEARVDDSPTVALLASIEDPWTRWAVDAERATVAALGGGCSSATACYGRFAEGMLWLRGAVANPDGARLIASEVRVLADAHALAAPMLAARLLELGARDLLDAP